MRKRMACRLMLDDELGADERGMSSAGARPPSGRRGAGRSRRNPRCEDTTPSRRIIGAQCSPRTHHGVTRVI